VLIGAQVKNYVDGKIDGEMGLREYLKASVKIEDANERMADLRETFEKLAEGKKPELAQAIRQLTINDSRCSQVSLVVDKHLMQQPSDASLSESD